MDPRASESSSRSRPPRRWSRRWRWLVPVALGLALLLSIAVFILTRPTVLVRILTPVLARAVGGDVVVHDVRIEAFRTLRVGEILITAPGWTGESAEVVRAENVRVTYSLTRLLLGQVRILELDFGRLLIRAAERSDVAGEFNLLALRPDLTGGGEPMRAIPITLGSLELETGLVTPEGVFQRVGERTFHGRLTPAPGDVTGTLFTFALVDPVFGGGLHGTWDDRSFAFSAQIDGFEFDGSWLELAPLRLRQAAEAIHLSGRIKHAEFTWAPEKPFSADFELSDLRLTMPTIGLEERWARVRGGRIEPTQGPPTIHVQSGRLRTEGRRIRFHDISGAIVPTEQEEGHLPVPARLSMTLDLGAGLDENVDWNNEADRNRWIEQSLRLAPFELSFAIDGFDSSGVAAETGPVLDVPRPVARALETFGLVAWKLDVAANFSRGMPTRTAEGELQPAPIRSAGQAFLSGGSGAYRLFPYPLREAKAHLTFELNDESDERFTVDYLTGYGLYGGKATIRGIVERPGPNPRIDLKITGIDIPIDEHLFNAFPPRRRKAFTNIFNQPAADALLAAGLLPDKAGAEAELDQLRRRAGRLETELAAATDDAARERIRNDITRTQRMIAARPFELGGIIDFECSVTRPPEVGAKIRTEGTITLRRAGALIAHLPYPLVITKGVLRFDPESFSIDDPGLEALTLEGGLARLTGRVDMVRDQAGDTQLIPDLRFVGVGDRISPLLLAALPPPEESRADWPGKTLSPLALALERVGFQADIDVQGRILAPPHAADDPTTDDVDVRLTVAVAKGSLEVPKEDAGTASVDPSDNWTNVLPPGLRLDGIEGLIRVEPEWIDLDLKAETVDGLGSLSAAGRLSMIDRARNVEIALGSASSAAWIGPYLEARVAPARAEGLSLWERLAPRGTFDATLRLTSGPEGPDRISAELLPRTMVLGPEGDDPEATILLDGGRLVLDLTDGGGVLRLDGVSAQAAEGSLSATGEVTISALTIDRIDLALEGRNFAFESPFVDRLLAATAGDSMAAGYRGVDPAGRFDTDLFFRRQAEGATDWNLVVRPTAFALSMRGARPEATFTPGSSIEVTPTLIRMRDIEASIDGGHLRLSGEVDPDSTPRSANVLLSLEAHTWTPAVAALLPPPVSELKSTIGFTAAPIILRDMTLKLRWDESAGPADPRDYSLAGMMTWRDASFAAGLEFTEADGSAAIDFSFDRSNREQPTAALTALVRMPTLLLYGRRVTDVTADIELTEGGGRVLLRHFDGTVAEGRLAGEASYDVASRTFSAEARLVGARLEGLTQSNAPASEDHSAVDGMLSIKGIAGDIASRRGVGRVSVRDAKMADAPITMRLLQLTQLSLPLSSSLSEANIDFFIRGPFAYFERFQLTSEGIQLDGTGRLDTRDLVIAANFRTRGRLGFLSDLIGLLNDQIFDIEVTGPLDSPSVRLRPLPLFSRPASAIREEMP